MWRKKASVVREMMYDRMTLRPGDRVLILGVVMKWQPDLHIEYWMDKLFSRIGWPIEAFPHDSPDQLMQAFEGLVSGAEAFSRNGVEFFRGTKL